YIYHMLTDDGRCTCEIKSRIAMAKAAFSKKNLFTRKLDLNLRKKLVKCYVWSIALYGAGTWTLRAVDQKHLESFEMWCWRRMEKIGWTDYVRNEEVVTRNRGRGSTWGCLLGAVRVAVICFMLMVLKPKSLGCWKYLLLVCLGESEGLMF
ncbi:hypothetical protein B7P43_G09891, partial [Cryptotermes secundus]